MPIDIDGFAVLGAIAARPDIFSGLKGDASKVARQLVIKKLKEKTLSVDSLVELSSAVSRPHFDLIVGDMSDAEIKTLAAKLDKHNAQAKTETPQYRRALISGLATGEARPSPPAAKTSKARAADKPQKLPVERAISSKAMKAKRKIPSE